MLGEFTRWIITSISEAARVTFNLTQIIIINVALIIGATLQGSVGYGMGLLVSPILILVSPRLIPGPFLVAALVLTILMVWREHQEVDLFGLRWVLAGCVPGTILGIALLSILPQREFNLAFGFLLLLGVIMSIDGVHFPIHWPVLLGAGFLSGVMGVIGAIGGPPVALVYQESSPGRLRSTISGYFIISTLITLGSLAISKHFGWEEIQLSLIQIPGIIVGFFISFRVIKQIGSGSLRPYILWISAIAGALVIIKQILR
jgi:uncharacterized protein